LQLYFSRFLFADIGHFDPIILAVTDEPYYQYRQVSSDFLAGTDGILAGSGKFLPMAPRYFKGLVGFLFLYLKRLLCMGELSIPRQARPLRWRRRVWVTRLACKELPHLVSFASSRPSKPFAC
jgi:hypothetical protein